MVGKPSIFVRLAGCNLRCYWCDTSYTWLYSETLAEKVRSNLPEDLQLIDLDIYEMDKESHPISINKIISDIKEYPANHVVITGGEPLLQKKKLTELTNQLVELGYTIEIETNGTISPVSMDDSIHFNVSPKLENSYNSKARRYKPKVLKEFISTQSIFKFVIANKRDIQEVKEIIEECGISKSAVYLMPEGRKSDELLNKSKWLVPLCKQENFNYSHRLHVDIFEKTRGI